MGSNAIPVRGLRIVDGIVYPPPEPGFYSRLASPTPLELRDARYQDNRILHGEIAARIGIIHDVLSRRRDDAGVAADNPDGGNTLLLLNAELGIILAHLNALLSADRRRLDPEPERQDRVPGGMGGWR